VNLRELSDSELFNLNVKTAEKQRAVTLELLNQLNEVERRHLYSKFACASLHEYCVNELKMTSGNACHHINAARLMREIPAIEEKVRQGVIGISTITQAEAFFKREARSGNRFASERKAEVLQTLERKSTRDAEKILISHSSQPDLHFKEKVTQKTNELTEVRLYLDCDTINALEKLKEVWSHALPHATFADLIRRAAKESLEKNDPQKKIERALARRAANKRIALKDADSTTETENMKQTPALGSKAEIRRIIWRRDQSQCTFIDPRTNERCKARHFVEEDHIIPKGMGGSYTEENMRLRCRTHNQRHAIDSYGPAKMDRYHS
jgi:hypothetical protein